MPAVRGARPIRNSEVLDFHESLFNIKPVTVEHYSDVWKEWMNYGNGSDP